MVLVPSPSGGSMDVSSTADAVSKGWTPSMGTFGTSPDGTSGQSTNSSANSTQAPTNGGLGTLSANEQAQVNAQAASAGTTLADLAEKKRQFDATLEWTKQMWQQQGLPQLQIQQQAQALAQQEYQSQTALAQQNFGLAQQTQNQSNANNVAGLTGYYNAPQSPVTAPPTGSGTSGFAGASGLSAGMFVKDANSSGVGQVQADGSVTAFHNVAEYQAAGGKVNANGSFDTPLTVIPQAQFQSLQAGPPVVQPAAAAVPQGQSIGTAAPSSSTGAPNGTSSPLGTQTLAGAQQQATLSGTYNGAPTEAARQFNATQAQQQEQFNSTQGLAYLNASAALGGPANYYQSAAFNRGAQSAGQTPAFLTALQNNTGMPVFNTAGGAAAAPGVQSMSTLAGGLTGASGGAPGTSGGDQGLSAIGAIGAAGGQALAPQAWENMNPDEQALFTSGMKASGNSMPAFLQQYQQSRIAQGAAQAA